MSYNRYYKNAKLNIFFEKTKVMERFLFQVALYVIAECVKSLSFGKMLLTLILKNIIKSSIF